MKLSNLLKKISITMEQVEEERYTFTDKIDFLEQQIEFLRTKIYLTQIDNRVLKQAQINYFDPKV